MTSACSETAWPAWRGGGSTETTVLVWSPVVVPCNVNVTAVESDELNFDESAGVKCAMIEWLPAASPKVSGPAEAEPLASTGVGPAMALPLSVQVTEPDGTVPAVVASLTVDDSVKLSPTIDGIGSAE